MKLTAQHYKAIELLASGCNGKGVAEKLGVAGETVSRWRHDFDFQAALNKVLQESQQESRDKLRSLSLTALSTIEAVMLDNKAPHKDRLTASLKILEIVNIKLPYIGSTDASTLKTEKEQLDLLKSYGL